MEFVSALFVIKKSFSNQISPGGDGPSAILTGTHEPGQFCFVVSGSEIAMLGPATITNPTSSQSFSAFTSPSLTLVPFTAQGLLVSKEYTIQVNGANLAAITSTILGRASASLDLSSFPDGVLTISLVRNSDSATVSVDIIKDTNTFVSITSPTANAVANQFNFRVEGSGEVGGSVTVTIQDSTTSTPNLVSSPVTVLADGTWVVSPLDLTPLADGVIRITASIVDLSRNTATSNTVTITKDTRVLISILAPTNLQYVVSAARAASVSVSGFADVGSTVVVSVNDADTSTAAVTSQRVQVSPVGTWSVVMNLSRLQDGLLTITAFATDAVGNVDGSAVVNLTKDSVLTGYTISTPTSGSSIDASQASALVISGAGEAGGRVSLRISGSYGFINRVVSVPASRTWSTIVNISNLPNGLITISATATDLAGNSGSISSVSITKML